MAILEEKYSPKFPIDFRYGGDTRQEAFGKLIREIEAIYGVLNYLNASKTTQQDVLSSLSDMMKNRNGRVIRHSSRQNSGLRWARKPYGRRRSNNVNVWPL